MLSAPEPAVKVEASGETPPHEEDPNMSIVSISMVSIIGEDDVKKETDPAWEIRTGSVLGDELKQEADPDESLYYDADPDRSQTYDGDPDESLLSHADPNESLQSQDDGDKRQDSVMPPKLKKQRLDKACVNKLGLLSIDVLEQNVESITPQGRVESESSTTLPDQIPTSKEVGTKEPKETTVDPEVKVETSTTQPQEEQEQVVKEFNRNTEDMVEVYFKEGVGKVLTTNCRKWQLEQELTCIQHVPVWLSLLDEAGIEMFDTLLGPFRRPTK